MLICLNLHLFPDLSLLSLHPLVALQQMCFHWFASVGGLASIPSIPSSPTSVNSQVISKLGC